MGISQSYHVALAFLSLWGMAEFEAHTVYEQKTILRQLGAMEGYRQQSSEA